MCIFAGLNGQRSTFLVTPMNTCFVMGGEETDVQFNCSVNRATVLDVATLWSTERTDGSGVFDQISSNEIVTPVFEEKFSIEGDHNLVIKNVEASDELHYLCENSISSAGNIHAFVYLIILGKLNWFSKLNNSILISTIFYQ